jgi:ubiquinone/menaquinone biosynthesis C-methylase UbiE
VGVDWGCDLSTRRPEQVTSSPENVKRWYDNRYAAMGDQAMRPFDAYPPFLDALAVRSGATLLDVSCGAGHLLRAALERGLHSTGIDISEEAVRLARANAPAADVRTGDCEHLEFPDASFDFVTCLGSLEHFPDMDRALAEMCRVARPDARFCIVVPNSAFLVWRLFGVGTEQQQIIEQPMTLPEWRMLFFRNGLRVIATSKDRWYLKRPRWLGAIERVALWALWRALPLRHTYQFLFVLEKDREVESPAPCPGS